MKLALTSVLLLLTFAIAATATPVEPCTPGQTTPGPGTVVAQSGCCMFGGGMCGCDQGRVRCCDGRLSSNCRC